MSTRSVQSRRRLIFFCVGVVTATLVAAWLAIPWKRSVEIRALKEPLPAQTRVSAAWWNDDGTRAIAVGANGAILERVSRIGESGPVEWRTMTSGTTESLTAVAGGDGPWRGGAWGSGPRAPRVFVVGAHGALVDCTSDPCAPIRSGTDEQLHAVAITGGQAIAVGARGTIRQIVPDPTPAANIDPRAVHARAQSVVGVATDLRSIWLECTGDRPTCFAVAVGDDGALIEGNEEGACDDGVRVSGQPRGGDCRWEWIVKSVHPALGLVAVWRDEQGLVASTARGERVRRSAGGAWVPVENVSNTRADAKLPVHVVERKLWLRRERAVVARVAFGSVVFADIGGGRTRVDGSSGVAGIATPLNGRGEVGLLVSVDGELLFAR